MSHRFDALHRQLQGWVDDALLPGAAITVQVGGEVVDEFCCGWADREADRPLRPDTLCRGFSNTKLFTTCAALQLWQDGRFALDDPVPQYLPALADLQVLRPGATALDQTEPLRTPITVRHLFTHSAGFASGLFDPGTPLYTAYHARGVRNPRLTLAEMTAVLGTLPLAFQPGSDWAYSMATDVLARLVEVVGGEPFDAFLQRRLFAPLGLSDTMFVVPADQQQRFAALYAGADAADPWRPGLQRLQDVPYPGAYVQAMPRLSGGGGLVTTLADMATFLSALRPGSPAPLLGAAALEGLLSPQLPEGQWIDFSGFGRIRGRSFSLGGAVSVTPWALDPADAPGDLQWGGIGGTHWWLSPQDDLAVALMTQRHMGFWHPFWWRTRQLVRDAVRA